MPAISTNWKPRLSVVAPAARLRHRPRFGRRSAIIPRRTPRLTFLRKTDEKTKQNHFLPSMLVTADRAANGFVDTPGFNLCRCLRQTRPVSNPCCIDLRRNERQRQRRRFSASGDARGERKSRRGYDHVQYRGTITSNPTPARSARHHRSGRDRWLNAAGLCGNSDHRTKRQLVGSASAVR